MEEYNTFNYAVACASLVAHYYDSDQRHGPLQAENTAQNHGGDLVG